MCSFRNLFLFLVQSSFVLLLVECKTKQCKPKPTCKWIDNECDSSRQFTIARCTPGTICRNYQYVKREGDICPIGYKLDRTVRCTGEGQNTDNFRHFCCLDSNNYTVSGMPYLTPKDFENAEAYPDTESDSIPLPHDPIRPRSAFVRNNAWPYAQVPYVINNGKAGWTVAQRAEIAKAMKNYEDNTCVRFYYKTDDDKGWVSIENDPVTNTATNCGLSQVCGPYTGSQFSSVGPPCANAEWLVHELGHSLCFDHEHQREDRDTYISFNSDVCSRDSYPKQKAPQYTTQNLTFDYDSIWLYPGCRPGYCFQRQPGHGQGPCGEAGTGRGRLSYTDIRRVNLYHKCDCSRYIC